MWGGSGFHKGSVPWEEVNWNGMPSDFLRIPEKCQQCFRIKDESEGAVNLEILSVGEGSGQREVTS
jgi:hypothetical protein